MNQEQKERFEAAKIEAQKNVQKAIDVLEDAINKLYELRRIFREDTFLGLHVSNIVEDEENGIQKKRDELRNIKSQIASISHT